MAKTTFRLNLKKLASRFDKIREIDISEVEIRDFMASLSTRVDGNHETQDGAALLLESLSMGDVPRAILAAFVLGKHVAEIKLSPTAAKHSKRIEKAATTRKANEAAKQKKLLAKVREIAISNPGAKRSELVRDAMKRFPDERSRASWYEAFNKADQSKFDL